MLTPMIFTNGRLIFPERITDGLSLRVEAGKIVALGRETPIEGKEAIDLEGNFLAPGFIDLHVHGAVGRDTMEGTTDAFRAICDYHAGGGTTSLLLTTVTAPFDEILHVVRQIATASGTIPQLRGTHVEGPHFPRERGASTAIHPRAAGRFVTRLLRIFAGHPTGHIRP